MAMNKEKEIEEIAKTLYAPELEKQNNGYGELCRCRKWYEDEPCNEKHKCQYYTSIANRLQKNGYGNIEQAVRDFAEELKGRIREASAFIGDGGNSEFISGFKFFEDNVVKGIDELIKERFGK